jgi:PleD family two-component response regulator
MTGEAKPQVLIVDDDEAICKTLSAILQSEGYHTEMAVTAREAIAKASARFFDVALLDIKLPDMEGTQLLAQLQKISPETVKIMVTGYPSLKNAVEALNLGAHSYVMKPINPAELLKTMKCKLDVRYEFEQTTKEKLARWIQLQARKTGLSSFDGFLEEIAGELAGFGLTKTQAKIYVALVSLGAASASEVASLSKIRREEVYRVIPELEKRGIVTRKLGAPRKFLAIKPEAAIEVLTKAKLTAMKEEVDVVEQKGAKLVSTLKTMEIPIGHEDCSIEVVSQRDTVYNRLTEVTAKAKRQIDIIAPVQELKLVYANRPRDFTQRILESIRMRIITEKCELDEFIRQVLQIAEASNNSVELRQAEKLPFNLVMVDDKEAMWGETEEKENGSQTFWTDDPTQIRILKMSFESLWNSSQAWQDASIIS